MCPVSREAGKAHATDHLTATEEAASASDEIHLVGPAAAAQVEIAWAMGEDRIPGLAGRALQIAADVGHATTHGEVTRYLQRMGALETPARSDPTSAEPWTSAITGDWQTAAGAWGSLGERFERAVELALSPDLAAVRERLLVLEQLGATSTAAAISRG